MFPISLRRTSAPSVVPDIPLDRFLKRIWDEFNIPEDELTASYPVDIREDDTSVIVDAEMPGFKRDEISVNIENNMLHIAAERKSEKKEGKKHLYERRYSRIDRSLSLPAEIDDENVTAKLKDGILHLEIPKTESSRTKQIEIT